jgi:hypothetical protein
MKWNTIMQHNANLLLFKDAFLLYAFYACAFAMGFFTRSLWMWMQVLVK